MATSLCLRHVNVKLVILPIIVPSRTHIRPPRSLGGRGYKRLKGPHPETSPNLAQRLQELNPVDEALEAPVDIGLKHKHQLSGWRKRVKEQANKVTDKELEQKARHRELSVPLDEVAAAWIKESGPHHIQAVAEHYGIYKDLFGAAFFLPVVDLQVNYDYDEEYVTPVFRGNIIPPSEAQTVPNIHYDAREDSLWTLIMTNPDGHLTDNTSEYLHWAVGNIPGNQISQGETLVDYLQPFPPRGTGLHRHVFLLFKQDQQLSFKEEKRHPNCTSLKERTFKTLDFYRKYQDDLTAVGLAFFQSDWDRSVRNIYHNVLDMREPAFEFIHPDPYHPKQVKYPHRQPFDRYYDRYRDKKDLAEEVLKMKLERIHPSKEYIPEKYPLIHRPRTHRASWLKRRDVLIARKIEQFKDLP